MAIQGVQGNIFELLTSGDRKVQDFLSTLKTGDTLRGRVLDVVSGENRAVINFKGNNLVSQLPQNSTVQRGDVISVTVQQTGDKVFMKLNADMSVNMGRGAELQQPGNQLTPQQIINMLSAAKVPVNEQNIFTAQKLVDYHVPVTNKNISDINNALGKYMDVKGIDVRAFNVEHAGAAKEILLSNFVRMGAEAARAAQLVSATPQAMTLPVRQDAAARINNLLTTVNTLASAINGASASLNGNSAVLNIEAPAPQLIQNFVNGLVREGIITQEQAPAIINGLSGQGQPQAVNTGSMTAAVSMENGTLNVSIQNLAQNISGITAKPPVEVNIFTASNTINSNSINLLSQAQASGLFESAAVAAPEQGAVMAAEIFTPGGRAVFESLRSDFESLSKNIFTPDQTSLQANVKDTASLLARINTSLQQLGETKTGMFVPQDAGNQVQLNQARGDVNKAIFELNVLLQKAGIDIKNPESFNVQPQQYMKYQAALKQFMTDISTTTLFKPAEQPGSGKITVPVNAAFDMESTIESLAFLKSRDIPVDSNKFIDIMGKYFRNDMKLNQNVERLSAVIDQFTAVYNAQKTQAQAPSVNTTAARQPSQQPAAQPQAQVPVQAQPQASSRAPQAPAASFTENIYNAASKVREFLNEISIQPKDSNLKQEIITNQIKSFIEKSGMNIENKVREAILNSEARPGEASPKAAVQGPAIPEARDNLKSMLIKLSSELNNIEHHASKLTPQAREALIQMRETANDILTNLNALQFINQKPVAYDMIYTQIPVFLSNKFFNGEIQVWYRKGGLKDSREAAAPVNIVFILNTTNMGSIKISMSVFKNDVECSIRTDNEKAKQVLTRGKNDFFSGIGDINYNLKAFNIRVEEEGAVSEVSSGEGYIEMGRINFQA